MPKLFPRDTCCSRDSEHVCHHDLAYTRTLHHVDVHANLVLNRSSLPTDAASSRSAGWLPAHLLVLEGLAVHEGQGAEEEVEGVQGLALG